MNDKMIRGANFCHVAKIIHLSHESEVITEGNQKWNGAMPNLIKIADKRTILM